MPSNKFKHFSVIGKSKKNYGNRVSQEGIALPHVLLAKGFTVKELGPKRSKVYSTKVIPTFKTSELTLRNGARALDEHTIEIQAKNRTNPEDPQPIIIRSGEAMWVKSWERPEGGEGRELQGPLSAADRVGFVNTLAEPARCSRIARLASCAARKTRSSTPTLSTRGEFGCSRARRARRACS